MGNYSCYVAIDNSESNTSLRLKDKSLEHGDWVLPPPASIDARQSYRPGNLKDGTQYHIHAKDRSGLAGTEGVMIYTTEDEVTITMKFCCSFSEHNNEASITFDKNPGNRYTVSMECGSGKSDVNKPAMPTSDHPCYCIFKIKTSG